MLTKYLEAAMRHAHYEILADDGTYYGEIPKCRGVYANAPAIFKVLRSRNPKTGKTEKLYVIKGLTFDGFDIYTKGKILKKEGVDIFYVLISSKRSTDI